MLNVLQIEPPVYLFLTLAGVAGTKLLDGVDLYQAEASELCVDRNVVIVPEKCIKNYDERPHTILKDVLDSVWNACGYQKSFNYKDDGSYANRQFRQYTFS